LRPGVVGPLVTLPIFLLGIQLDVLAGAKGAEKLIQRLYAREPAAFSELHSITLCVGCDNVEIEIEPLAVVGDREKIPDFRIRRPGEQWVWVEVTRPNYSESAQVAQQAAGSLRDLLERIPDGMEVQLRFRADPCEEDLSRVRREVERAILGQTIDQPNFIIHTSAATPVLTPIGGDEQARPISGNAIARVCGEQRAVLSVRVPYTDLRGQQVIDAEARQLPKEGPGLICISTDHGKYWRSLIERSFSPKIRTRISAVLLFSTASLPGQHGIEIRTAGHLVKNPHARAALPAWLETRLHQIPAAFHIDRLGGTFGG